jgi:hypothetical protein
MLLKVLLQRNFIRFRYLLYRYKLSSHSDFWVTVSNEILSILKYVLPTMNARFGSLYFKTRLQL